MNIDVSPRELMEQTDPTIKTYLAYAVEALDEKFGEGYAEKHPDLVGTLVAACTTDFKTAIEAQRSDELSKAIEAVAEALRSFEDQFGHD